MENVEKPVGCGCTGGCRSRHWKPVQGCILLSCGEEQILHGSTVHTHPENDTTPSPNLPTQDAA